MDEIFRPNTFAGIADEAIKYIKMGDMSAGFYAINKLYEQGVEIGGAIGSIVNEMEKNWTSPEGESFLDAIVRRTPLHPTTVKNHLVVKRFLENNNVPEHVLPAIQKADQKTLIRIAKTAEGYDLEKEDWEKIAESAYSGEQATSLLIRKITKEEPRSNWLMITIDEKGVLTVHSKEGHFELGRLNIRNQNETVQKGIKRIINNTGIQDQINL